MSSHSLVIAIFTNEENFSANAGKKRDVTPPCERHYSSSFHKHPYLRTAITNYFGLIFKCQTIKIKGKIAKLKRCFRTWVFNWLRTSQSGLRSQVTLHGPIYSQRKVIKQENKRLRNNPCKKLDKGNKNLLKILWGRRKPEMWEQVCSRIKQQNSASDVEVSGALRVQ